LDVTRDFSVHSYFLHAQCEIPDGAPVPKAVYRAEWERGDGEALWENTIYKSANVFKGGPHEVG